MRPGQDPGAVAALGQAGLARGRVLIPQADREGVRAGVGPRQRQRTRTAGVEEVGVRPVIGKRDRRAGGAAGGVDGASGGADTDLAVRALGGRAGVLQRPAHEAQPDVAEGFAGSGTLADRARHVVVGQRADVQDPGAEGCHAGVGVDSAESLGAPSGLGQRESGRSAGDVAQEGTAAPGRRIQGQARDVRRQGEGLTGDGVTHEAAEGQRADRRVGEVERTGTGRIDGAALEGEVVRQLQRPGADRRRARERIRAGQGDDPGPLLDQVALGGGVGDHTGEGAGAVVDPDGQVLIARAGIAGAEGA